MTHEASRSLEATKSRRNTVIAAAVVVLLLAASVAYAALHGNGSETSKAIAEKPASSAGVSSSRVGTSAPSAYGKASTSTTRAVPGAISRPGVMSKPAMKGSRLATLSAPPEQTIGMIVVPKDLKAARFRMTFEPYGWGPSAASGARLIARVQTSEPVDDEAKSIDRDFAGRNLTLWIAPDKAEAIRIGGTYSGVVEVRRQGDVGVMYLVDVAGK